MLKVVLRYPGSKATKRRKFKVVATTKGSVLRNYIGHCMSQFRDADYVLIPKHKASFLKESKPLTKVATSNVVKLSLVMRSQSTSVMFVDGAESTEVIEVDKTAKENVEAIVPGMGNKFVFAFKRQGQDWYQITAQSKPLVFQGWNSEPLLLIRRLTQDDLTTRQDEIEKMFVHAKTAAKRGLSFYSSQQWGVMAVLQAITDDVDIETATLNALTEYLPQNIRNDEVVIGAVSTAKTLFSEMDKNEAIQKYVQLAVEEGSQCCFVDKVKLTINDQKKLSYRWLFLSPDRVGVTHEFGLITTKSAVEFLNNIAEVTTDNDLVTVTFCDGGDWKVRSENPRLLKRIFSELTWKPESSPNIPVARSLDDMSEEVSEELFNSAVFDRHAVATEKARVDEVHPGISKLVCPDTDEDNYDYDPSDQIFRELKIITPLVVPDDNIVRTLETVPDFSWMLEMKVIFSLNHQATRIILSLVALLIACFVSMDRVL